MITAENISNGLMKLTASAAGISMVSEVAANQLSWFDQYIQFMNTNASAIAATVAIMSFFLQVAVNIYRIRRKQPIDKRE